MNNAEVSLLAEKAQVGDLSAFSDLIIHFQRPLMRYIQRISSFTHLESEEVLQESFIKAWRYIKEYDISFSFSTWLYRIVHQTTISEWRKQVSRGREFQVSWDDEWMENIAGNLDLEKHFESQETSELVRKSVALLPEKYREVLILKFLEEKSYEEISDILKIPVGTSGSLVSRAKKKLKDILQRNLGTGI